MRLPVTDALGTLRWSEAPHFSLSPDQWGVDLSTTAEATPLTWGYLGGTALATSGVVTVAGGGTVLLADNATNYLERTYAGAVSVNQIGCSPTRISMAVIVSAHGVIAAVTDWRAHHGPFAYYPILSSEIGVTSVVYPYGDVRRFGGVADAKVIYDASIRAGAKTLTSASAAFAVEDVAKVILITGAGPSGVRLSTAISAYVNATTVSLADVANTTVSGVNAAYGSDNTAAVQGMIDAAAPGAEVVLSGAFMVTAQVNLNKKLKLRGSAIGEGGGSAVVAGSRIIGSGFTIVLASSSFVMEDLQITDPVGHLSTIALDIDNGSSGVVNWELRNVYITSNHTVKRGTGVRLLFALKGAIVGGIIEGWNLGVDFQQGAGGDQSNANAFLATKIRVNTVGLNMGAVGNVFCTNCTIEGNGTGVEHASGTLLSTCNHYENNVLPRRNIHTTGTGSIVSTGDGFYSTSTDSDVYIESGAGRHSFVGTVWNAGLKHTGTGIVTVQTPLNAVVVAGTGPIARIDGGGIQGLQGLTRQVLKLAG